MYRRDAMAAIDSNVSDRFASADYYLYANIEEAHHIFRTVHPTGTAGAGNALGCDTELLLAVCV